jgi:predicted permease
MLHVLALVAPVFGLIAVGFVVARTRFMSEGAGRVLTELGFKIAIPVLLFRAMLDVGEVAASPVRLALTYFVTVVAIWLLTALAARLLLDRPAADRPALAMATTFGNGVMLGFPLIVAAFGPQAQTPLAILAVCDTIILWLIGTLHMAMVRNEGERPGAAAFAAVLADVARNPLLIALISGAVLRWSGLTLAMLPLPAAKLLELVAQAGVPVSLMGIGMSLAAYRIAGELSATALILVFKLLITPLAGFAVATWLMGLPPLWAGVLTLFLAMPVGANAFLFASRYDRAVASVSASVALSTIVAVFTVTLVIAALHGHGVVAQVR